MIEIKKLSKKNLKAACDLVDDIFVYEKIKPHIELEASLSKQLLEEYNKQVTENILSLEYWIAELKEKKEVVGVIGIYEDQEDSKEAYWLGWFCVAPGYREHGVGHKLLEYVIKQVRKRRKAFIRLYSAIDPENEEAQMLYIEKGFKIKHKEKIENYSGYKIFYRELKL
jgi:GNAT superfamily N-acetyltransferase